MSGSVIVDGQIVDKPGAAIRPESRIEIKGEHLPYVSRGGLKLAGALKAFALEVSGWICMDIGASTGGFTDCLLQRGAAHVVAVDVGHGQLHPKVRDDPRVTVIERYNVRSLSVDDIGGPVDAVVADLSFISLTKVLEPLLAVLAPGGHLVALVKPQFEAGRSEVAKARGVITDPAVHDAVRESIDAALRNVGADVLGWTTSPLRGAEGNVEFLVHARTPGDTES
jgi:23S rRNA (cytidine1920-2'-O)/16S rRNA (cytidine1409-2'-O)-methyltransferase